MIDDSVCGVSSSHINPINYAWYTDVVERKFSNKDTTDTRPEPFVTNLIITCWAVAVLNQKGHCTSDFPYTALHRKSYMLYKRRETPKIAKGWNEAWWNARWNFYVPKKNRNSMTTGSLPSRCLSLERPYFHVPPVHLYSPTKTSSHFFLIFLDCHRMSSSNHYWVQPNPRR